MLILTRTRSQFSSVWNTITVSVSHSLAFRMLCMPFSFLYASGWINEREKWHFFKNKWDFILVSLDLFVSLSPSLTQKSIPTFPLLLAQENNFFFLTLIEFLLLCVHIQMEKTYTHTKPIHLCTDDKSSRYEIYYFCILNDTLNNLQHTFFMTILFS